MCSGSSHPSRLCLKEQSRACFLRRRQCACSSAWVVDWRSHGDFSTVEEFRAAVGRPLRSAAPCGAQCVPPGWARSAPPGGEQCLRYWCSGVRQSLERLPIYGRSGSCESERQTRSHLAQMIQNLLNLAHCWRVLTVFTDELGVPF